MDIVRGTSFIPSVDAFATISEDCMVKIWNMADLEKKYSASESNPEPYLTLRGHTGHLLCVESVTGERGSSKNANLLFTAGIEGSIRVWNVPKVADVNVYGDTLDGKNYCCEIWQDESNQEAIWSLKYHPFQELLLSISASNTIMVWDCSEIDPETINKCHSGKVKQQIILTSIEGKELEAPTCCSWLNTQQTQFVVGYNNSLLIFFNVNDGSVDKV